jgi:hypothetical protein
MTITRGVFDLFFAPGEVAEIRALGCSGKHKAWGNKFCSSVGGGPVAGYFDNDADFAQRAAELDTAGPAAVYFTINPVLPDLLARAVCRLKPNPKSTTNDADVVCLRWLYVDLDPKRPAGISATDAELALALEVARAIVARLEQEMGFARAVRAESGNGYHLLYRIPDLAPTDENKELLRSCLKALAALHSTPEVDVDEKNFNPARICKLYGTTARKGDSTPERPHRPSRLRAGNPAVLADVPITPLEKIKALAAMAPPDEKKAQKQAGSSTAPTPIVQNSGSGTASKNGKTANALGPLNVTAYLEHYGIAVHSVKSRNGAVYFCLEECLFDANHRGGEAMICQSPTAPFLTYQCFHNSCRHKRWQDARLVISGNDAVA